MSNKEAAKLIIQNISSLEEAVVFLAGEISENFMAAVDKVIEKTVSSLAGEWSGHFSFFEDSIIAFEVNSWKIKLEASEKYNWREFYAQYHLDCESNAVGEKEGTVWWLTSFLSNPKDNIVLCFTVYSDNFKNKPTKKIWREFAKEFNSKHSEMEKYGFKFKYSDGSWYLPIPGLDQEIVAESYTTDTLEDALQPISDSIKKIELVHPYFEQIVQEAIDKFGRVDD